MSTSTNKWEKELINRKTLEGGLGKTGKR